MDSITSQADEYLDGPRRRGRRSRYEIEKIHGLRRETGAYKITQLKARHYRVLFLHMEGASNYRIAEILHLSHCHVSLIINDPISQEFISRGMKDIDGEFRALLGPTAQALRDNLQHRDPNVRQKAADSVLKVNGKFDKRPDTERTTAEDLIQKLLAQVPRQQIDKQVNIQINSGDRIDPFVREALGTFGREEPQCPDKEQSATASIASAHLSPLPVEPLSLGREQPAKEPMPWAEGDLSD